MLTLELDPDLEARLASLARRTDRSPDEFARELVTQGLDDLADGRIALEHREDPEGWYTLEDLEQGRDRRVEVERRAARELRKLDSPH